MFAIRIDTACSTEAGHLSSTMAATEYSQQPKPELLDDQQWDTGEMSPVSTKWDTGEMSPVSTKWDTFLDKFADVFMEPTQLHPRPIQH